MIVFSKILFRFLTVFVENEYYQENSVFKEVISGLSREGENQLFTTKYVDEEKGCHEHYHLKCIECGKLIHVDCTHIDEIQSHIEKHHNFSVDKSRIVLYGTCSDCMGVKKDEKDS